MSIEKSKKELIEKYNTGELTDKAVISLGLSSIVIIEVIHEMAIDKIFGYRQLANGGKTFFLWKLYHHKNGVSILFGGRYLPINDLLKMNY
ncbi:MULTISPECIES: hypothetical protein [Bacillus]|uniref:Uncharacterized protein n=2 Tax=Bacillus TaxID=1386 RepID=A0A0M3R9X1_9BACI|nr:MULTISPECIES: hypothetical protein [Bacillus]ALC82166.1 hypothetical protein AM592_11675 [Bacillus gobiensis]MBP1080992.1 hypothetical protein [Bacillus capparidis]MED1095689.1 hypothetical protein [Bacillus capparidis]